LIEKSKNEIVTNIELAQQSKLALETTEQNMQKQREAYLENKSEADAKRLVIRELKNIIMDELINNDGQSSEMEFLEIKNKFVNGISNLEKQLEKKLDKDSPAFTPVFGVLVQLAVDGQFASQKILRKILATLNKFEDNVTKFLIQLEENNEINAETLKSEESLVTNEYQTLLTLIADQRSLIIEQERLVSHYNYNIVSLQSTVDRKTSDLNEWSNRCNGQKEFVKNYLSKQTENEAKQIQQITSLSNN